MAKAMQFCRSGLDDSTYKIRAIESQTLPTRLVNAKCIQETSDLFLFAAFRLPSPHV